MPLDKPRIAAVRSFLRNFNALLKAIRLYGPDHKRVKFQSDAAWTDLQATIVATGSVGFVLGVSGSRLVLDGEPLEVSITERGLTELLSANGLDSVQFTSGVTQEELIAFVRACAAAGSKGSETAEEPWAPFMGTRSSIRVNQVRFVASGPGGLNLTPLNQPTAPVSAAAPPVSEELPASADDPLKLLKLMLSPAAPETKAASVETEKDAGSTESVPVEEEEAIRLVQVLVRFADGLRSGQPGVAAGQLKEQLGNMPITVRQALQQTMVGLSELPAGKEMDRPLLLQLGEQLAIRFALERMARGGSEVVVGQKLLDRMTGEIESLRKVLSFHEEKMEQAGLQVESAADVLDRKFWAGVPESGKRTVLLSPEAWCIPPRNVRQYVEQLIERGDSQLAEEILKNYANCVQSPELRARLKVAPGIGELADLYGRMSGSSFLATISLVASQMAKEPESQLHGPLGATFVKLAQEGASRRNYAVLGEVLASLGRLEQSRPGIFSNLRAALDIENKFQEFIDGSLRLPSLPSGIGVVLQHSPQTAMEILSVRLARCLRRRERDRIVDLAQELGTEAVAQLSEIVRSAPPAKAAPAVGLLSRLDPSSLAKILRIRLPEWHRSYHDLVVQQVGAGGGSGRGELLAGLLDVLDSLVLGDALEEIGLSGEQTAASRLHSLAKRELPQSSSPYLCLKSVEALGRLRDPTAVSFFTDLVTAKRLGRWVHHRELRIVAAQSLQKTDPEMGKAIVRESGLTERDLSLAPLDPSDVWPGVRPRRYQRIRLSKPVVASLMTPRVEFEVTLRVLSLGGGLLTSRQSLPAGVEAVMKLNLGLRNLIAKVFLRGALSQGTFFSIAEIDLDERLKLRSLLTD